MSATTSALQADEELLTALLEVAQVRYAAFLDRFGRDPEPDEPLLFDPTKDEPTAADWWQRRTQLLSAALMSNTDTAVVLRYLDPHLEYFPIRQ